MLVDLAPAVQFSHHLLLPALIFLGVVKLSVYQLLTPLLALILILSITMHSPLARSPFPVLGVISIYPWLIWQSDYGHVGTPYVLDLATAQKNAV